MDKNKKLVLVYGSLRPNEYNHNRFKDVYGEEYDHKRSLELDGYDLYSLGSYPGIKEGKNKLKVDLFECSDKCYSSIRGMELGAGYSEKVIELPEGNAVIYMYNGRVSEDRIVENGDWVNRK